MDLEMPAILENDFEGYRFLLEIFHKTKERSNEKIALDFSNNDKFDLNLFAVLVAFSTDLNGRSNTLQARECKNHSLVQKFTELSSAQTVPYCENNIPYRYFSVLDINSFYDYIQENIFNNVNVKKLLSKPLEKQIANGLGEVFGNVQTHTSSKSVFCCGQIDNELNKLDFSIVNLGTTVRENVQQFTKRHHMSTIEHTIEWAVAKGNTTKTTTGGLGLHLLQDFIVKNEGRLQIISHNEFYELHGVKVENRRFSVPFSGTIVNIEFNLSDTNRYRLSTESYNINDLL